MSNTFIATEISWWLVAIAAIGYYLLGALWFTPLFGRAWDRSIGYDRAKDKGRFPVSYYVVPLVAAIVASVVIAVLAALIDADPLGSALLGASVGAVVAAATLTNALTPHTPHPYVFAAVTGGYHLLACTLAGLLVGLA